ncbi:hypothetical protein [Enterobacter phage 02_vB_Eclo_IJM]|nr:hypothetical protein [Enterobacter phage 02_vB_Eclo_IJM]
MGWNGLLNCRNVTVSVRVLVLTSSLLQMCLLAMQRRVRLVSDTIQRCLQV